MIYLLELKFDKMRFVIKLILLTLNILQLLIVFFIGIFIVYPDINTIPLEKLFPSSTYGIGHWWGLITLVFWKFYKKNSRKILLKISRLFDNIFKSNFERTVIDFIDFSTLEKIKKKEEREKRNNEINQHNEKLKEEIENKLNK